ncbi:MULTISPECIES: pilus assembly protein TadG-related protein [unclassified Microbacterium]|uniref:pilus assembly protein TadG-related protein n=1 Tax=unclassified Microbacterium TaxID=2609290 RepID=UPI0012FC82E4|nr:pilus assembly protein TadG-related protein [Microbacterium sp. MAH-37]
MNARDASLSERGAVAVLFAFLAVPLLVVLAFVCDAGLLYWEKAELQNGADAAALAVAQNCIQNASDCSSGANTVAAAIASDNANDDASAATVDPGQSLLQQSHGKAFVTASSPAGNGVAHPFASLLDPQTSTTLQATASVEWGAPVSGSAVALTIAKCEFVDLPPQEADVANPVRTWITIEEDGNGVKQSNCSDGSPGGFGWLDGTNCVAEISIDTTVGGTTGIQPNSNKNGCSASVLQSNLCKVILIPLYSSSTGSGASATFTIERFAAFKLTGLKTSGANSDVYCGGNALAPEPPAPKGKTKGIQGYFVRYVELGEDFQLGSGGPDGALTIVRFTS